MYWGRDPFGLVPQFVALEQDRAGKGGPSDDDDDDRDRRRRSLLLFFLRIGRCRPKSYRAPGYVVLDGGGGMVGAALALRKGRRCGWICRIPESCIFMTKLEERTQHAGERRRANHCWLPHEKEWCRSGIFLFRSSHLRNQTSSPKRQNSNQSKLGTYLRWTTWRFRIHSAHRGTTFWFNPSATFNTNCVERWWCCGSSLCCRLVFFPAQHRLPRYYALDKFGF